MSDTFDEHRLPSAEDLDAVAREQEIADATVNIVNTCVNCGVAAVRFCAHCGQDFCATHFCITHELGTERVDIVDEDGTEHHGQRVRLIGEGWPNHLLLIKDLNDEELVFRIKDLQRLLADAIRTKDYTQVSLAAHEFELGYRQHSRYVSAMKRREKIQQGTLRLNNKRHRIDASGTKQTIPADIAALMKLGLSYENAVQMKTLLGKAKP
jgi:hypothetical protein